MPYRWFDRFGENPQVKAFVNGVTAAAAGAIAGACVVLGRRAIFDLPTALIGLAAVRPALAPQGARADPDRGGGRGPARLLDTGSL